MLEYRFGHYGVQCLGGSNFVDARFPSDMPLVGSNSKASGEMCNVFGRNFGCLNEHLHVGRELPESVSGQSFLGGLIGEGFGVIRPSAQHCSDPLCPLCCYSWARKVAKRALNRFDVFGLVYGDGYEVRHVTVSVPRFDWDKPFSFLKRQCLAFAGFVGVDGGISIFHPKRYNRLSKSWYFSPHFHFVCNVRGGVVDGSAVAVVSRLSGYVLRNFERRKSIRMTLLYQLSHAGVQRGHKQNCFWFGNMRFSVKVNADLKQLFDQNELDLCFNSKVGKVCPVCGSPLKHICRVAGAPDFDYEKYEDSFVLDSVKNWVVVPDLPKRVKGYSKSEDDAYDGYVG